MSVLMYLVLVGCWCFKKLGRVPDQLTGIPEHFVPAIVDDVAEGRFFHVLALKHLLDC